MSQGKRPLSRRSSPSQSPPRKMSRSESGMAGVKYKINFSDDLELDWFENVLVTAHAPPDPVNNVSTAPTDVEVVTGSAKDSYDSDEDLGRDDGYDSVEEEYGPGPDVVGRAVGRLMRRHALRSDFWTNMEEPSQDTSHLGFKVYGRLQSVHKSGPKKGSGVWGAEADVGNMLQVETITVNEAWQRKNIATNLLKAMISQSKKRDHKLRFAFTFPAYINHMMPSDLPESKQELCRKNALSISQKLARKIGFRRIGWTPWFALATDPSHASHRMMACDDFNPPEDHQPSELDKLEKALEKFRTRRQVGMMTVVWSDRFRGHQESDVMRLLELRGIEDSPRNKQIAKYGCTCGQCHEGYLSSRMHNKLMTAAEIIHGMTAEELDEQSRGTPRDMIEISHGASLWHFIGHPGTRANMYTNKSLRTGFSNLFDYAAQCLRDRAMPTARNIIQVYLSEREWPPCTRNFLERGGTPHDIIRALVGRALKEDEIVGCGTYLEIFKDQERELLECRNDKEFGFVLGMLLEDGTPLAGNDNRVAVVRRREDLDRVPAGAPVLTSQRVRRGESPQTKEGVARMFDMFESLSSNLVM